jgi:hypothetical protein
LQLLSLSRVLSASGQTETKMRKLLVVCLVALPMALLPLIGSAKGCLKGAVVGGAVGHVAGHHAVLGAAAGCVIEHHREKVKDKEAQPHVEPQNKTPVAAAVSTVPMS